MSGEPPKPPPMRQIKEPCAPLAWIPFILAVALLVVAVAKLS